MVKKGRKRRRSGKTTSREKAGSDSSDGEEKKLPLGFACPDCLDFQMDLAKSSLNYYRSRKSDPNYLLVFDEVRVFSACFLNSWPRMPSSKYQFYRPTLCEMMDPSDPDITYGCKICPPEKKFPHPPRPWEFFNEDHPSKLHYNMKADGYKHHHRLVGVSGAPKRGYIKLKEGEKRLSKRKAAEIALTYCNMYSNYEVKEVAYLEKMPFFWVEIEGSNVWYHVGFVAKPNDTGSSDASPKRFFGELKFDEDAKSFLPSYCCILEDTDCGVRRGCGFCPFGEKYLHPADGYRCGAWVDPPRIDFTEPPEYEFDDGPSCSDDSGSEKPASPVHHRNNSDCKIEPLPVEIILKFLRP